MVSSMNNISKVLQDRLLQESETEKLQYSKIKKNANKDYLEKVAQTTSLLPSVLDKNTLMDIKDGKYEISLKDYTNLTTYSTAMSNFYGNNSANVFQNMLNNMFNNSENGFANSKLFIDKLKENGVSNKTALKMYSAFQSYSIMSTLNNFNNSGFVSAKI